MRYRIVGEPLPVAICDIEPGETIITERGSMSWMSPNIKMETTGNGGLGKMIGRAFSGESMFQNKFTCTGGIGQIAFASSFPGSIRPFEISPGNEIICQKSAFLASDAGVELSVFFQRKLGAGFFGGEGFIMQRLSGYGTALVEIDGYAVEYDLQAGQSMIVDTGYLACMSATCTMDVQANKGLKNMFFGGEGLFNTVVRGPGKVILQSLPAASLARALLPYMPVSSN
ncbi:MAG: TIGR00266 family protein [Ruminococcaceae bacterium]|nr:TIGR00266 family protein [Oscillospiraceae bacterium]